MFCRSILAIVILGSLFSYIITPIGGVAGQVASQQTETTATEHNSREDSQAKSFFESPIGVQIAWYASIAGVILGLIPLGLYFQERNKSKLLNGILERYDLAVRIETDTERASTSKATTEQSLQKSKQELSDLTKQLEDSIPNQARAAFFRAAIPEIDRQMLYLQEQRKAMEAGLSETGVPLDESSRLQPILRAEIDQTVMARRRLEEKQTVLSIFARLAAGGVVFSLIPLLAFPIRLILGVAVLWAVYDLFNHWSTMYPEHRIARFVKTMGWKLPLGCFLVLLLGTALFIYLIIRLD